MTTPSYLINQKKKVRQEKTVGAKIICITEGGLKGRECLVVVLQSIDTFAAM
jgi:hypothetical protein